ncbi:GGDEF domain-containing protein [Deinococcus aquatilis]|uniref:GGDEF domain-containing protein n=1 Tax=Deinococcus aquatilis TaxID=519440 RepID=UPI0003614A38|nr:diguanylate cyclase [Deinococcus aquatilis]
MLRALFLNACVLITLTYLLSLTYQRSPVSGEGGSLQRLVAFNVMGTVLLFFPAQLAPGVVLDLRAVPVLLVTLEYGLLPGLGIAASILSVRYLQGGAGVLPAALALLSVTVLAGAARRWVSLRMEDLVGRLFYWAFLLLLPYPLTLLLLPNGEAVFMRLGGPLVLFNAVGLLVCASILVGRFQALRALQHLTRQAEVDALTGLANRRRFNADLAQMDEQDALLLIDIDHFKRVNDTFGHAVGDEVLEEVARCLAEKVRTRDTVYRYGGEEFALILRRVESVRLVEVAERLRAAVEEHPLSMLGGGRVTVSIGVACYTREPALLERADAALYAAKRAGRNRVCVHPDVLHAFKSESGESSNSASGSLSPGVLEDRG